MSDIDKLFDRLDLLLNRVEKLFPTQIEAQAEKFAIAIDYEARHETRRDGATPIHWRD